MSIFKSTLDPIIAAQLKARESVVSQLGDSGEKDKNGNPILKTGITPRDDKFLRYTSGKNAWVKMTSFVNYNDPKGNYTGEQLAKKYVLEGGTLLNNTSLRGGVGKVGSVYGSELDKISANTTGPGSNTVDRLYGLRPMPGIESANIINISAYGSLREATVNFYAWDKHQLSELEILFMRPGYTVLLEWGWSQYLKHDVANNINNTPDKISIENFTTGIDAFSNYNENAIYAKIEELNKKYCGNYDAMLGFVKNFSWKLMPNGGFQCTTVLISRGEALETLKASANPNIILGSQTAAQRLTSEVQDTKPVVSFFERVFLNLIGYINDSEIAAKGGQLNTSAVDADGTPSDMTSEQQESVRQTVTNEAESIISKVKANKVFVNFGDKIDTSTVDFYETDKAKIKPIDGGVNGSGIEYITFDFFIAILNTFFIPRNSKKDQIVNIVVPYLTPFLISDDTVSIDPTTCLFSNPRATFLTNPDDTGFVPETYSIWKQNLADITLPDAISATSIDMTDISSTYGTLPVLKNIGRLGLINISVQKIIDIYRGLYGSSDGVSIVDLLNGVLDSINLALGGINNFKLYTTKNLIQIIDAQYLETGKNDKFLLDPIGLKSVCRDVRINSRIYSEQASMIAIGATSGEYNNLGDIYSSTQNAFNRGLKDRVIGTIKYDTANTDSSKIKIGGTEYSGSVVYYYEMASNLISLINHIKYKVLGVNEYKGQPFSYKITRVPSESEVINASSLLQSVHYQINGKDVNYKSFIPFELEIELDGIGGFITGQIFKISKNALPKSYNDKNFGFIIMKQSHSLKNNDWITTLSTQVCLLDNESLTTLGPNKEKLKSAISTIITSLTTVSYLKYAMADYLVYLTKKIMTKDGSNNPPLDIDGITSKRINDVLSQIGEGKDFKYKTFNEFLKDWVEVFQPESGQRLQYTNPSFKEGRESLPNFPKTVDDIAVVIDPEKGTKVPFNKVYFEKFVFDKETADSEDLRIKNLKKELEDNEAKRTGYDNKSYQEKVDEARKNASLSPEEQLKASTDEFKQRKNVAESTNRKTFGDRSLENAKLDLSIESLNARKNTSFLNTNQIEFTVDGSPYTLPPIFQDPNGSDPSGINYIKNALKVYLKTESTIDQEAQVDITYMDVKSLYTYYLNYITNVYLPKTNQEIFIGGLTNFISLYWGVDDTKHNIPYYKENWYQSKGVGSIGVGVVAL